MKTLDKQILVLTAAALVSLPAAAGGLGGGLGGSFGGSLGGTLGGSLDMSRPQGAPASDGEGGFGREALGGVHHGLDRGSRFARDSAAGTRERADAARQRTRDGAARLDAAARRDRELSVDADAPTHAKASRSAGGRGTTAPVGGARLAPVSAPAAQSPAAPADDSTK